VADPTVVTLIPFRKVISPSSPPSFIENEQGDFHEKSSRMSIVHPHAAGVDIGAEFHVVAVPPDADTEPVRTFQSFTGDLQRMSDWLKTCHITTVAMESTGVYWLPALRSLKLRVSR
jgi:hypothetical protein